jgi:hypothetical protein
MEIALTVNNITDFEKKQSFKIEKCLGEKRETAAGRKRTLHQLKRGQYGILHFA